MAPQLPKKKPCGRKPDNTKSTLYQREKWRKIYHERKAKKTLSLIFLIILCLSSLPPARAGYYLQPDVDPPWDNHAQKDADNPIFTGNNSLTADIDIGLIGDTFYALFPDQAIPGDWHIYIANSTNLKDWTLENSGNPILSPEGSGWEQNRTSYCSFLKDINGTIIKDDGVYWIFYVGLSNSGAFQMGRANATTITGPWTKDENNPIDLFTGENRWSAPVLFKEDSTFYLYHSYKDGVGTGNLAIHLANSTDLITWVNSDNNPLISPTTGWQANRTIPEDIAKMDGYYYLLINAYDQTNYRAGIKRATTIDSDTWTDQDTNPIISPVNATWEADLIDHSTLVSYNNRWNIVYNGVDLGISGKFGIAYLRDNSTTPPEYSLVDSDMTQEAEDCNFSTYWEDIDDGLDYWIFSWDESGSYVNDSAVAFAGNPASGWSNVSKTLPAYPQTIHWKIYANDTDAAMNVTSEQTLVITSSANASLEITNIDADDWVFEGNKRYNFELTLSSITLSTINQVGIRFTDEIGDVHIVWYDRDANTLTATSPEDGISGWLSSLEQSGSDVVATFQIMFNTPIPDTYDVLAQFRLVTTTDTGWVYPTADDFSIYNLGGLSTLTTSGTAGRVTGGDVFEIKAADTRTKNIIPVQDFDVRNVPLQEGWQVGGVQIFPAGDEQALLEELEGWKTWMASRTETRTIYPTNRLPDTGSSGDLTYNSYPFGLLIKSDTTTNQSLIMEREFFRKVEDSDGEIVTVEVWAAVANDTKITGQILISDDGYVDDLIKGVDTDTKRIVDFKFFGNGNIRLVNGTSGNIYPATYSGMVWANYTFVMNLTAQTYDFYVDEVLKESDIVFREAATSVGHISFLDTLNPVFPAQPVEFYVDDIRAYTDFDADYGGYAEATMLFNQLQHWSMDFDFFVESGQVYAQGASGTPQRTDDDYSDYGYIELGWDVLIDAVWVEDFLVARVNISDGYISGKNNWIKYNVTWYVQGDYIKNDLLYGLFEGYSIFPGSNKDTSGFHWDIWFNRANASTVIGARINTEYYGMSDKSLWWAVWSSNWKPMRTEVSESTIFVNLEDANGTINSAKDVGLVRSKVKVLRNTLAQFAYKVVNIAGLDFMVAKDTMSGIDTPPIRDTKVPDVMSGFLGSTIGGIFAAALKRLGNTLSGFGMDFFSMSIDFIDNVFAALGYPALVSTIFGWMDTLFSFVPTLLGYAMTLIGNIYTLINTSASDALTQVTSLITIWAGMYATVQDFITGVYTPGLNLWNDLGVSSMIEICGVLYPFWLLMMWGEKGSQAVFDHLNSVLNIGGFFLNFILNIGGFFMNLLTALIGAIRG